MGCVLGREVSSGIVSESKAVKNLRVESNRKVEDVSVKKTDTTSSVVEIKNEETLGEKVDGDKKPKGERRWSRPNSKPSNLPKQTRGEQVAAGWPPWLSAVCGEALNGWIPRRADTFEKIDKIGSGTYSNVYKARDLLTGKVVALKKVRFDNLEPESVKFMAREILILRRLDHPNVVKLEGLVTSRMSCCILAELLAGKPIMPGRTEVEQLHKIYKLCGSPSDEYWKKSKLPNATLFKPREPYKRCIRETFKDFSPSSLPLIETLLAIDPAERQTATAALKSEFFTTEPYACEPSSLPKYPPSKEMDAKRRDDEARRLRTASKAQGDAAKKTRTRERHSRGMPAPDANAELPSNIDRRRLINHANAKSKSEKFPPPHQDGALGYPLGSSHHIDPALIPPDVPFSTTSFTYSKEPIQTWSGPLVDPAGVGAPRRKKKNAGDTREPSKLPTGKDKSRDTRLKGKKSMA
ncbi:CELL DIVISION PROTEIN KINASE [Salix purpurea]|uniref:CELL DIVISION PROTEIN KINASE n=1 Tax=Salix purpurea TaxID=77065 RepID=A0A9Q0W8X7_SALPP|nr:CELL DIVISION PROTEIN KINASE [Salix purpurea]